MICNLIGQECLKEECVRYDDIGKCRINERFGEFLYHPLSMFDMSMLFKYLEEIRPDGFPR